MLTKTSSRDLPPCERAEVNSGFVSSVLGSQLEVRGDEVACCPTGFYAQPLSWCVFIRVAEGEGKVLLYI